MAQRSIEVLVGRLITDEAFRSAFVQNSRTAIDKFIESGHELTPVEITALLATPFHCWTRAANQIDARLQKINLRSNGH